MASVTGKVRSRKDGSAVPLDDLDRKLLNLMQGQFPLAPRPYAAVAEKAEVTEAEVMARVQRLLDDRIIRQVTPIYDTRAFGYGSMLVAAKVDAEHPWRAATIINSHPGVSHNYLRNHEFNMWFTIAVEEDSAPVSSWSRSSVPCRPSAESSSTAIVNHMLNSWLRR